METQMFFLFYFIYFYFFFVTNKGEKARAKGQRPFHEIEERPHSWLFLLVSFTSIIAFILWRSIYGRNNEGVEGRDVIIGLGIPSTQINLAHVVETS